MELWIFLFIVAGFWPPVQPDTTTPNSILINHQVHNTKLSPNDVDNVTNRKEEEMFPEPKQTDLFHLDDNVTVMVGPVDVTELKQIEKSSNTKPEPTNQFPLDDHVGPMEFPDRQQTKKASFPEYEQTDLLEGYMAFCEELAKNISYIFEEKRRFGKAFDYDRSHLTYSLYKETLNSCERMFKEYADLAFELFKEIAVKCETMFNTYSIWASGYCKDIAAECGKQFNEVSNLVSGLYYEIINYCNRLYNDHVHLIGELYEEPANSIWKLLIDYKDMTLDLYNQTVLKLQNIFNVYSQLSLEFYNNTKVNFEHQYDMVKQQISLTYCADCIFESPLFYNLTAALVLIHVHLKGLNIITLIYIFLKFFTKSKLLISAFRQFVEPIHSAMVINSKIYLTDNQMPNDQVYCYLLIFHFIASILITLFMQKKSRVNLLKFLTIACVGIYIKKAYTDGRYSSASSFNLDNLTYNKKCLYINPLESDILLIFMAVICFYEQSETIAASKTNSRLTQFIGGHFSRFILYFIMLTSILPAFVFLVSKSANVNLDFWPYKQSLVCQINRE